MTISRRVYQCRICGSIVKVLRQNGGGLTCCGTPLNFYGENRPETPGEKEAPPLDLTEVRVGGHSHWQLLTPAAAPWVGCAAPPDDLTGMDYGNLQGQWRGNP